MALPVAAAVAARAGPRLAQFLKKGGGLSLPAGGEKEKPDAISPEGIIMKLLAGLFDIANGILAILDIAMGLGTILAPLVNGLAGIFIGGWIFSKTGKLPIKKVLLPFGAKCLPLIRIFPFWSRAVSSCFKKA